METVVLYGRSTCNMNKMLKYGSLKAQFWNECVNDLSDNLLPILTCLGMTHHFFQDLNRIKIIAYKFFKSQSPKFVFNIIPFTVITYNTRNTNNSIPQSKTKHDIFRNYFSPFAVIEWNKLDLNIRNSESFQENYFKVYTSFWR